MADENSKPKATLIKHKKTDPAIPQSQSSHPPEKKKVVVVKKKRVVVKKASPPAPPSSDPEKKEEAKPQPEIIEKTAPAVEEKKEPEKKPEKQDKPAVKETVKETVKEEEKQKKEEKKPESPPSPVRKPAARSNKPRQAYMTKTQRLSPGERARLAQREASSQQQRQQRPPQKSQGGFRKGPPGAPDQRGGRPAGGFDRRPAPSGPRVPPSAPPETPADQKPGARKQGKKTFKQKKKIDYAKKKEQHQERDFQIKKKSKHRANPIPKKIDIMEIITVSELARKMNLKASELIAKLMSMGMMVTINQQIDSDTAQLLAAEYSCEVNIVSLYDETVIEKSEEQDGEKQSRPPIVTVMGHVDHGKTKLLDAIRSSDVVADEFGGITQHIGAYSVSLPEGTVVFLDTPGHSAFTLMRSRGAQITDIVILVVAANDGVMPQTVEAINHAKAANVPIIVAVNKIDLPESNPDRVKQQLSEYGLIPESWGGQSLYCEISALKKEGIPELLDTILLQSEMLELTAEYECRAEGRVIESKVEHGRGIVASVIIQRGTLRVGDPFVAGIYSGKVRALFDDHGKKISEATPSMPVEILGFGGIPNSGSPFQVTENEKQSRNVASKRQELERQGESGNMKKVTLDNLFDSIQDGEIQEFKVIIKGDVHGSVEALQTALEKLSTSEIKLIVIHASAGAIVENDINLAVASNAIVIGFNVRPTPKAQTLADKEKIDIRKYNIIYDAVDDIKSAMEGMLSPDLREDVIGRVEVRETFKVPKIGVIAGCYVLSGQVKRNSSVHVLREDTVIHTGKINSLKRFKDDVRTVESGYECGIGVANFQNIQTGDILEVFETVEVKKKL